MESLEKNKIADSKKAIAEKTKFIEKKLLSSKNEYETFLILKECYDIIEAEIYNILNSIENLEIKKPNNFIEIKQDFIKHLDSLYTLNNKFKNELSNIYASAKKFEDYFIKNDKLYKPCIFIPEV